MTDIDETEATPDENTQEDDVRMMPPFDNLVRATAGGVLIRATEDGSMPYLEGHGAVFNQWTKIDSAYEGLFMERVLPGAFTKTLQDSKPKILFDHGQDPQIGNKVLAPTEEVGEDETGLFYGGRMFDTSYNHDLAPALAAGAYGSSFRFSITRGKETVPAKRDARGNFPTYNPDGLPERTIREVRLMEMGPVVWPAYLGADAGLRSLTDQFVLGRLASDPGRLEQLVREIAPQNEDIDPAPSLDAGTTHLEPERRDEPVPSIEVEERKEPLKVAELLPADRATRMEELRNAIRGVAESYTGALPSDVDAKYQTDKQELADLERDEAAFQARKVDLEHVGDLRMTKPDEFGRKTEPTWGANPPNIVKKPDNIYGGAAFQDIFARAQNLDQRHQLFTDYARRGVEVAKFGPTADTQRSRDRIDYLLESLDQPTRENPDHDLAKRIIGTGGSAYKRAFESWVKVQGRVELMPQQDLDVMRGTALGMSTTTTGGFLVPYAFDPTIIAVGAHTAINPYRRACRTVDIVGANIWHALTSTAVVAVRGVEALVAAEAGPTFAQPSYTPSRVQTQITYSIEVGQDRPNIGEEMAVLIQEAKDNEEEASFAVGTGATTMLNVVGMAAPLSTSGAYTSYESAGSVTLAAADYFGVEATLPIRWRMNAVWFMSRATIRGLQALETAYGQLFNAAGMYPSPGYPAVGNPENSPWGNTGLKLLGYPVYESPSIPSAKTSHYIYSVFCDPSTYVIVDRVGMDVEFIPFIFGSGQGNMVTGQRALYAVWRNAAAPITVLGGLAMDYKT